MRTVLLALVFASLVVGLATAAPIASADCPPTDCLPYLTRCAMDDLASVPQGNVACIPGL